MIKIYDFNFLVSFRWGLYKSAKQEIIRILNMMEDEKPLVKPTIAEGIIGVKTCLDPREVIPRLRTLFYRDPLNFQHTLKWIPVDLWTHSDMESMKEAVVKLRYKIRVGERWRMTVEKRRYTQYHKIEIIRELADLIDEKVDLKNADKILRIDIIGKYAGLSVLTPNDVFSIAKLLL